MTGKEIKAASKKDYYSWLHARLILISDRFSDEIEDQISELELRIDLYEMFERKANRVALNYAVNCI